MFQGLSQGSIITIFYRNIPRVSDGKVISVNTHMPVYSPTQPMAVLNGPVTDLTVQVGNETIPFVGLPANGITANFPEKNLFISTDRTAIIREVEAQKAASKQALEQVPANQKMYQECDNILMQLTPERQREAQQTKDLESMKTRLDEMGNKFNAMFELITEKLGIPVKEE